MILQHVTLFIFPILILKYSLQILCGVKNSTETKHNSNKQVQRDFQNKQINLNTSYIRKPSSKIYMNSKKVFFNLYVSIKSLCTCNFLK